MIRFVVEHEPVPQPRPRFTMRGGFGVAYTPKTVGKGKNRRPNPILTFRAAVLKAAQEAYSGPLIEGPVRVDITFIFPRQSNKVWKTRPMPRYRHTGKPDRDNLDKPILDVITGVIIKDDGQVCSGTLEKWRASGDEHARCEITITQIEEQ